MTHLAFLEPGFLLDPLDGQHYGKQACAVGAMGVRKISRCIDLLRLQPLKEVCHNLHILLRKLVFHYCPYRPVSFHRFGILFSILRVPCIKHIAL